MSDSSSTYYKSLFEYAPDVAFVTDLYTTFLELNQEARKIFVIENFSPGKTRMKEFVVPEDLPKMKESFSELKSEGKIQCHNWRMLTSDNEYHCYEVSATLFDNNEIVWYMRDFTQLKNKLNDLFLSEKKFRSILEKSRHTAILLMSAEGIIEFVNRKTLNMFGYTEDELLKKSVEKLLDHKYHDELKKQLSKVFSEESIRTSEYGVDIAGKKKNGTSFPVDITLTSFITEKGTVIACFIRDLSDRKRFEAQQKFLSDKSRILVENFDSDILLKQIALMMVPFLSDFTALYIHKNGKLEFRESVPSAGISGKVLEFVCSRFFSKPEVIPYDYSHESIRQTPLHFSRVTDQLIAALTVDESHYRQAKMLIIKEILLIPLVARKKMLGMVMFGMSVSGRGYTQDDIDFAENVTRRFALAIDNNLLYQTAQQAIKTRQEILAVVSHDLKNPLTVIRSTFQVIEQLMKDNVEEGVVRKLTNNVSKSIRMMESMISDLLDMEKIEAGTFSIVKSVNSVNKMISDLMDIFRIAAKEKNIDLISELENKDVYISCDYMRIMQVLSNLVGNAIKFTDLNGKVTISVKSSDGEVEFRVKDTGQGMSKEEVSNLFQRFWQANKTAHLGTGLGLYIARSIVEAHNGVIAVESMPEKGSEFYFVLPKRKPVENLDTNE